MSYKQLKFAREYRGLSQTELSRAIPGLSQSNLSKFEKGFNTLSEDSQKKIIEFLNFPSTFLDRKISNPVVGNYRKRSSVSKSSITSFENKCRLVGYIIDEMSDSLDWPEFTFISFNLEKDYTPEYAAQYTRKMLGLDTDEPVRDICELLESKGIILYEIDGEEKFDGLSFFTDKGYPVIIYNKNFSNDRKRFTLAHELCHLICHNENQFPIAPNRNKEKEANHFAPEFLMPKSVIINSLRRLKLADIGQLKQYWLTSMASINYRAYSLGCISEKLYLYYKTELSRLGYGRREPFDVYIDRPSCFKNAYELFTKELNYTLEDFEKYFSLPVDILKDIFDFDTLVKLKITYTES